jgi:hypothetical protein
VSGYEQPAVIDATQVDDPTNADEQLALFLFYAEPGDVISMHSAMCRTHLGDDEACTCTPTTLTLGARA